LRLCDGGFGVDGRAVCLFCLFARGDAALKELRRSSLCGLGVIERRLCASDLGLLPLNLGRH